MKRIFARRPTPATAIACLALFVSLGGVSWGIAAGFVGSREIRDGAVRSKDVRDNVIRTQDLRNNEIRGRDIRNSTITSRAVALNALNGLDILESSLGPVPESDTLDGIDSSGFVRSGSSGFTPLALGPSASPAPGTPAPQVDVDPLGYVHLEGLVASGGGEQPLASLPVGARPAATRRFVVYNAATPPRPELIVVEVDGDIVPVDGVGAGDKLSLDGITFRARG